MLNVVPALAGDGRRRHRRRGHRGRAGRLARPGHACGSATTSCSPTTRSPTSARSACSGRSTSPSRRRPSGEPTGRLGDGDDIPLVRRPAATRRSRRCSARCRSCSAAAASAQLGTITREVNMVMDGPRGPAAVTCSARSRAWSGRSTTQKADIIRRAGVDEQPDRDPQRARRRRSATRSTRSGPAVEVLADQHDELIDMLGALDRLGEVGTRVISASKDDLLKIARRTCEPVLAELHAGRRRAGPGAQPAGQLPVPQGGRRDRPGRLRQHLDPRRHQPRELPARRGDPDRASRRSTSPTPARCSATCRSACSSGNLTSKACQKVLADVDLLKKLKKQCKKTEYKDNPVCMVLNARARRGLRRPAAVCRDLPGRPARRPAATRSAGGAAPDALRRAALLRRWRHDPRRPGPASRRSSC